MKLSRRRWVGFVEKLHQKACSRCSTINSPHSTNHGSDLGRCRCRLLNSLTPQIINLIDRFKRSKYAGSANIFTVSARGQVKSE